MGKRGLVVEGGGFRGIYAAGVLDVFMERGLEFDGVIGVSAGAVHGCSFVSKQKGRSIRYYKNYCGDYRFMSIKSFLKTGNVVGTQFCYHDLPERLDPYDYETFNNSQTEFYVTCSNLETGQPEYLKVNDMKSEIDLLRASASLPYLSQIVEFNGMKLLDGGCTDSIPLKAFQEMGYDDIVVVLTRHDGYVKKPEKALLPKLVYKKYPNFSKALLERHIVYNETLEEIRKQEKEGRIKVIRPSVELTIPRLTKDPEEVQATYDVGRMDAERAFASGMLG